jgi:hypothetical protein
MARTQNIPNGTKFFTKGDGTNPQLYFKDGSGKEQKLDMRSYGHTVKQLRIADRSKRQQVFADALNAELSTQGSSIKVTLEEVANGRTAVGRLFKAKAKIADAAKSLIEGKTDASPESETTEKPEKKKSKGKKSKKSKKSSNKETSSSGDDDDDAGGDGEDD